MFHFANLAQYLKRPDIHPIDAHEELELTERHLLRLLAGVSNLWTASDTYARISGSLLGSMLDVESARRQFFPLLPKPDMEQLAQISDSIELHSAEAWGRYLDFLDVLQGKPAKTEAHLETWRRVTATRSKIAQTPHEVVWQDGIVRLLRYIPPKDALPRKRVPLLFVFAVMNTPWILDLYPGHSFIEYMLKMGYDVYLVDWGSPTVAEKDWTFSTYAIEHLPRIVATVKRLSGCEEFSIFGWCIGAIISTLYASMRPNDGLKNLVLATAPLNFPETEFGTWIKYIDVDKLLDAHGGLMPAEFIKQGSQSLKPIDNTIGNYLALWHHLDDPRFVEMWHAMNTWLKLNVSMPGGLYRELAKKLYLGNELTSGKFMTSEGLALLSNVKANVLMIVAKSDHITPRLQSLDAIKYFPNPSLVQVLEVNGGHVGSVAGSGAITTTQPQIRCYLDERSA